MEMVMEDEIGNGKMEWKLVMEMVKEMETMEVTTVTGDERPQCEWKRARIKELTRCALKWVPKEEDRVEKFIGGLPITQGNDIAAELSTYLQTTRRYNKTEEFGTTTMETTRGATTTPQTTNTGVDKLFLRAYVAGK
ncbi:hypothetical protein Tco_0846860 [Tanacetum coccineum]